MCWWQNAKSSAASVFDNVIALSVGGNLFIFLNAEFRYLDEREARRKVMKEFIMAS